MLRACGVYLETAETFQEPLKPSCSTCCLSEWVWCGINFYVTSANTELYGGAESAFRAVLQVICCSKSAGRICRAAILLDLVYRFDSCALWYFLCKLLSPLVLLQIPATRNMQRQHWSMVGCSDPLSHITQHVHASVSLSFSSSLLLLWKGKEAGV